MSCKKILVIIIILCNSISYKLNAQSLPYQYLDTISKKISVLQSSANGMILLSDTAEISFTEENFSISPATLLATHSIYFKKDGKETLYYSEDLDFSKAISITTKFISPKEICRVIVTFPKNSLSYTAFENGMAKKYNGTTITFYCAHKLNKRTNVFYFDELFMNLKSLCNSLKIHKGLITREKVIEENNDYKKNNDEEFLKKHPTSILAAQAKMNLKTKIDEKPKPIKKVETLTKLDSIESALIKICEAYGVLPNQSISSLALGNPQVKEISENPKYKIAKNTYSNMAPLAKNKMAIKELVTNDNEDILKYEVWVLINTKELFDINYNANIDFIKKYIPEKYIIVLEYFDTKTVLINHPDINFTITIMYKEGTKKEPFIEDFIFQKK